MPATSSFSYIHARKVPLPTKHDDPEKKKKKTQAQINYQHVLAITNSLSSKPDA